ncbi:hypothetical protein BDV35DRAFT_395886 [Aspergillus flavus]|uniref:Ferric oxidoreductase domain-containing protein n=1 Tax=Aspergillus flavus TaxID=5059 RepID=A0A5N6GSP3_ASPFL|nr:hypothetical protein BDV35DRAFT_395886 [Aspergillus flavus]
MNNRHRWIRPYAWSDVLPWTIYLALNAFFVWYPDGSMETAARRSGLLALTNVCFTYACPSISLFGDILGAKLRICRQLHHAAGFMACVESVLHVLLKWTTKGNIQLGERRMVYGVVAASCRLALLIESIPIVRRLVHPIFFLSHYILCIQPSASSHRRAWLLLGSFSIATGSWGKKWSKATIERRGDGSLRVDFSPGRPVMVLPGQYVDLWMPSLNPWSWFQCASFIVTSWSPDPQTSLQLLARCPSRAFGFTWMLSWRALSGSRHNLALISGPHGLSVPVSRYETVLLIASDSGILAVKPYVDHLFHCVKERTSKTRRLCLVWQVLGRVIGMDILRDMGEWVNRLLYDDIKDETQMLQIIIFDPMTLCTSTTDHGRGTIYHKKADFDSILDMEVQGHRERLAQDVREERGGMLVMTSASDEVRDRLKRSVRSYLKWVRNDELDYQPIR